MGFVMMSDERGAGPGGPPLAKRLDLGFGSQR
jgi:hypothetical protein